MLTGVEQILDAVADLQLKVGIGAVLRERILVLLLPPPGDRSERDRIKLQLDDLVPALLRRHEAGGALPPSYELTRDGWLRTKYASRVSQVIAAFLSAFREHVTSGNTAQHLLWPNLTSQGLADSDYHLACLVAACFELQNGGATQTWDGVHAPGGRFGLPIDVDELIDVTDPEELIAKRRNVSYERLHARKVLAKQITGDIRRGIEAIYRAFAGAGQWPLSRTLHVQLADDRIDLDRVAAGRFARGNDTVTEGERTMLRLAGLLIPADADDARNLVVQVLQFVGRHARNHPEDRTINALTVMDQTGLDEAKVVTVARLLQGEGGTYVMTASNSFDVTKMLFYVSPRFVAHADAKDLWDIVLNDEEERRRWHAQSLDYLSSTSVEDLTEEDESAIILPVASGIDDVAQGTDEGGMSGQLPDTRVDLLLVVTTDIEHTELLAAAHSIGRSSARAPIHGARRTYDDLGLIGGARVAVVQTHMGTSTVGGSLSTIKTAIYELSPTHIIMVGIAFGVDPDKQPTGTVLVSEKVHQYEIQRVGTTPNGEQYRIVRGDKATASPDVLSRLKSANRQQPGTVGLLLSGEKLVDNYDFRSELTASEPEALGGEMEGSGLYVAASEERRGWCIVKAVCDWADGNKRQDKEARQRLAARNASEYVMRAIVEGGFASQRSGDPNTTRATEAPTQPAAKSRLVWKVGMAAGVAIAAILIAISLTTQTEQSWTTKTSDLLTRPVNPGEVVTTGVNLPTGSRYIPDSVFPAGEAACFKLVGQPKTQPSTSAGQLWLEVHARNDCGRQLRFTATFRYQEPE